MHKTYSSPLLQDALPEFAAELVTLLEAAGYAELAEQVPALHILSRCQCGDSFCATMYVRSGPPVQRYIRRNNFDLNAERGMVILRTKEGQIVQIEALYRDDVREPLLKLLPQVTHEPTIR